MMLVFPTTIPQVPLAVGYSETRQDARLRTSMDAGPDKVRRRFTAVVKEITCTFSMTKDELAIFEDFYSETLLEGSLSFDWTHPRTGDTVSCRFVEVPTFSYNGVGYDVSTKIEVLP